MRRFRVSAGGDHRCREWLDEGNRCRQHCHANEKPNGVHELRHAQTPSRWPEADTKAGTESMRRH